MKSYVSKSYIINLNVYFEVNELKKEIPSETQIDRFNCKKINNLIYFNNHKLITVFLLSERV